MSRPPRSAVAETPPDDIPPEGLPDEASVPAEEDLLALVDEGVGETQPSSLARGVEVIKTHLRHAPNGPGVYRMLGQDSEVLYVGKARSIRKRIASYTREVGHTNRIARMISLTASMVFVSTETETEALLLEANYIKQMKPRFNVLLRDDKSFPYILLSGDHAAPQITKHRGARNRKGDYFGPFASVWAVNRTLNALQRAFLLRSCTDSFLRKPHAAVPAVSDQALLRPVHRRGFARGVWRPGARGPRLPFGQEPRGPRASRRRHERGCGSAGI
jgi:excinuclease ABC subunit C